MAKVVFGGLSLAALRDFKQDAHIPPASLLRRCCPCSCVASRLSSLSCERLRSSSISPVRAKPGSRFALYGDYQDYVLIEPGKDETFVDLEELRSTLRRWLENWPGSSIPADLARFDDLEDAVTYLVESACELEFTDGSGTVQWFEVRL